MKNLKFYLKSGKMVEINYKCTNCDFSFMDKDLIFYLDFNNENSKEKTDDLEELLNEKIDNLSLKEESLNKENSDKMTKSLIAGFLYENYCPNCNKLIKTYIPENNSLFSDEEIEKTLKKEIHKESGKDKEANNFKILFFDFKNTFYRYRRNILENNSCPNCNGEMSLVISEKIPCPKCGGKLKEEF